MDPIATRALAHEWLKDLCLALKNLSAYPPGHPRAQEYLDRAIGSLERLLAPRGILTLTRSGRRLFLDQISLDRDRAIAHQLAEDLEARGIDGLVFESGITPADHLGFMKCLLASPERVAEAGGFGSLLAEAGVAAVKPLVLQASAMEPPAAALVEVSLAKFLLQMGRGPLARDPSDVREPGATDSASTLLARDPAAIGRALAGLARTRGKKGAAGPEGIAETVAETLERLAEHSIEEHLRDRAEILADI
ncbi:MAG TPA: hypothetical protein VFG76_05480, partial [Candidatus Polarisedimenticolia bacterium]|nr:hypothetical protein [Candidatus Polarisedimenticolia bacterium]